MHALRGTRRLLAGLALAALTLGFVPGSVAAKPWPNFKPDGYKLFAKSFANFGPNRVSLGLSTRGEVGVDTSGSGTVGGGYWPRGTANEYVFNSGLQIAGIIQGVKSASNPWGGDTTGAFFFDPKGTTKNSSEVTLVYNSANPSDVANWPAAGLVPSGDSSEVLFDPLLRGTVSASQGDEWFVTWEGDPAFLAGRNHPMGILAEYRVMGWNYPSGNEDIAYLVVTFYNITSTNPADYALHRPAMRDLLLTQATKFQATNNAKFGITLPAGGYTIGPMYAAFAADMDVGTGTNFISVNLPFAMGYSYQSNFMTAPGWTFDPTIFGSPFFAGVGFIGTKYLKGPTGTGAIQLFSGNVNGGTGFPDPQNALQLFRYLSAGLIPGIDSPCNYVGIPSQTRVCFMQRTTGTDTRHFQSSPALTIKPGASASIVVAYVFAAPLAMLGYAPTSANQIDPGDPTWTNHPDSMLNHPGITGLQGVGRVDSMTGFAGYIGQTAHNADNTEYQPKQSDFKVIPKSLLGKALVAQSVFDGHFLLPFAPDRPNFFLVPGYQKVTIMWKPSPSDAATPGSLGDAFFALASSATSTLPGGGTTPNLLYDPNYRKFDVEGYRIYRGRTDAPNALKMIAQFDYSGTVFSDYGGNISVGNCAPELGSAVDCPVAFTKITPGITSTVKADYNLNGAIVQVKYGDRQLLATGKVINFTADTSMVGNNSGFPQLANTGVPFIFVDSAGIAGCAGCGVYNGVRYYYVVTAFDFNSWNSGPSSLESSRVTKTVTVGAPAANYDNSSTVQTGVFGRSGLLPTGSAPSIDASGRFSGPFQPANGLTLSLAGFATQLLQGSSAVSMQYDSTVINSFSAATSVNVTEWFTLGTPSGSSKLSIPLTVNGLQTTATTSGSFTAITVDGTLASVYGGSTGYTIAGAYSQTIPGAYYTGIWGRGCANSQLGDAARVSQCFYNGPRWFSGANETQANPTTASPVSYLTGAQTAASYANAGALPGVATVHRGDAYGYFAPGADWRDMELVVSQFATAADYKLYWGAAGKIDSVIDIVHNEPVPFNARVANSWGVLNAAAVPAAGSYDARADLTATDFGCVEPLKTLNPGGHGCTVVAALSNTAVPGPIAFYAGAKANSKSLTAAPTRPNNGFGLYMKGRFFMFELTGGALPASGTVWTMRDYAGGIYGGNGGGGDEGAYAFHPAVVRPFTAPGAAVKFAFTVNNAVHATTEAELAKVHTVPDPYYVTSAYDRTTTAKTIKFMNLPSDATIRIYTASGILVKVLHNTSTSYGGIVDWDVRNRSNQFIASGVYFYVVESGGLSRTYRLTIVNFASNIQ